jgi:ring-1,2-phenylacetyl-CoA epoxidase subunit PaaE
MPKTGIQNIYVGFAAGSGITPVISIIKTLLSEEPMCNFILFYSNSAVESIIFREELEGIKSKYMDRFSMHYLLTREELESPLFSGRIDPKKIQAFSTLFFQPEEVEAYFLCGPEPMIFSTKETLEQLNVNQDKIHFELFTTPSSKRYETGKTDSITEIDPLTESHVRIILDGDRLEYTLPYTGTNILDSALNAGADVPFSCKGGVCCTCKAKLMEGQVHMDVAWGLEPDEIADGYILTCQSHPRSEKLLVNFDLR